MSTTEAPGYIRITRRSEEEAANWHQRKTKIVPLYFMKEAIINFFKVLEEDEENYKKGVRGNYQEVRLRDRKVLHVRTDFLVDYANRFEKHFDAYIENLSFFGRIAFIAYLAVFQRKLELFQAEGEAPLSRLVPKEHLLLYQVCLSKAIAAICL